MNLLKRIMPYIALLILAGLIYDGAIFYSRWSDRQKAEQTQKDAGKRNKDRKVVRPRGRWSENFELLTRHLAQSHAVHIRTSAMVFQARRM